jgi:hypothetical protein
VPWANYFAEKVDLSLAQRIPLMCAGILDREESALMQYKANPLTVRNHQLWTIFPYPLARLIFTFEYFKPLHANGFDQFPEFSILFALNLIKQNTMGVASPLRSSL